VPDKDSLTKKRTRICLLGASFDTGNLGVSALAESSIKLIIRQWPEAEVVLFASGRDEQRYTFELLGKSVEVKTMPVRFCANVLLPNHFCRFFLYGLLLKLVPVAGLRRFLQKRNLPLKAISEFDVVVDINGGDSFSDIYGMGRFLRIILIKRLLLMFGKKLVFLPQTYGPFKSKISRILARGVLKKASVIFARDRDGVAFVKEFLKNADATEKIHFSPDVAFVLDPRKPANIDTGKLEAARTTGTTLVGLNVSGLLFNGGYTRDNMFGLKTSYGELLGKVVDLLMKQDSVLILLVPHVFTASGHPEHDPDACLEVFNSVGEKYKDRVFLVRGEYNHNEIKYIIGMCDLFIGSRMHSCIAAISQGVPAIGLAYSKKFQGVFCSIGIEKYAINLHERGEADVLDAVSKAFQNRKTALEHLTKRIPEVQKQVWNILAYDRIDKAVHVDS
jgi:colanic acid/amylovoran biosynthesis protein